MIDNKLKLNADKTEFPIIGTQKLRSKLDCFSRHLYCARISHRPSQHDILESPLIIINILDIIFRKLVVAAFITFATFVVFAGRAYLSFIVTKTIALVSSRLDYCNSLYYNIALKEVLKLQRVLNCSVRVVTRSPRFSHSVPLLKLLHWLPVRHRIIFKICTITYQALSKQPAYLHPLLIDSFDHLILIHLSL